MGLKRSVALAPVNAMLSPAPKQPSSRRRRRAQEIDNVQSASTHHVTTAPPAPIPGATLAMATAMSVATPTVEELGSSPESEMLPREHMELEELGSGADGLRNKRPASDWATTGATVATKDVFGRPLMEVDFEHLFKTAVPAGATPQDAMVPLSPSKCQREDYLPGGSNTPLDGLDLTLLSGTTHTGLTPIFDVVNATPVLPGDLVDPDPLLSRELVRELSLATAAQPAADGDSDHDHVGATEPTTKKKGKLGKAIKRERKGIKRERKGGNEAGSSMVLIVPNDPKEAARTTDPADPDLDDTALGIQEATTEMDLDWVGPSGAFEFNDWEKEARRKATKSPPKSMKHITDEQLAFTDLNVLLNLMHKEKYTAAQIEETKKLRRKCKNRLSAKGSASKRRVQMSCIAEVNKKLVESLMGLKKRNSDLVESNQELRQSCIAATEEANRSRQGKMRFQAEIERLTGLVNVMAQSQQRDREQLRQLTPAQQ